MKPLTLRQKEILCIVRNYTRRYGYPPSLKEVAKVDGCDHHTIDDHLKAIAKKGGIVIGKGPRAFRVVYPWIMMTALVERDGEKKVIHGEYKEIG